MPIESVWNVICFLLDTNGKNATHLTHTHTNFGGVLGEYIHLDYTPAHNTEHTSSSNLVRAFSTNGRHSRAH